MHDTLTLLNSSSKLVAEQIQTDQIYKASKYHSTKSIFFRRKTAQIKFYGQLALIFVVGSKGPSINDISCQKGRESPLKADLLHKLI